MVISSSILAMCLDLLSLLFCRYSLYKNGLYFGGSAISFVNWGSGWIHLSPDKLWKNANEFLDLPFGLTTLWRGLLNLSFVRTCSRCNNQNSFHYKNKLGSASIANYWFLLFYEWASCHSIVLWGLTFSHKYIYLPEEHHQCWQLGHLVVELLGSIRRPFEPPALQLHFVKQLWSNWDLYVDLPLSFLFLLPASKT